MRRAYFVTISSSARVPLREEGRDQEVGFTSVRASVESDQVTAHQVRVSGQAGRVAVAGNPRDRTACV